jgi:formyltetrahydrofolate deformylase
MAATTTLIALLHGPDQPGIVAKTAGWIFTRGGNILHADQHRDVEEGVFFQRIEWEPSPAASASSEADAFREFVGVIGMQARVTHSAHRPKVALFVSKADHCFHDLVLRWRAGEFPCVIAAVISNHDDLAEEARGYGLAFHCIPVRAETKADDEAKQLALLRELDVELVVLARYMQVLSADFLTASAGR